MQLLTNVRKTDGKNQIFIVCLYLTMFFRAGADVVIEYPLDNIKENRVVLSSSRNILKTGRFITEEDKAEKLQNGSFEWEFEKLNGKDYEIIVLNYPKANRVKVNENSLELLSYIEDDYLFPFVAKEENEVWMRITL